MAKRKVVYYHVLTSIKKKTKPFILLLRKTEKISTIDSTALFKLFCALVQVRHFNYFFICILLITGLFIPEIPEDNGGWEEGINVPTSSGND